MLLAYDADFFLSSANAMTDDGILVNIDGNANRVSAIAQGPKHVIFIVGMNKVTNDLDSAMKRARCSASVLIPRARKRVRALTANHLTRSAARSLSRASPDTKEE